MAYPTRRGVSGNEDLGAWVVVDLAHGVDLALHSLEAVVVEFGQPVLQVQLVDVRAERHLHPNPVLGDFRPRDEDRLHRRWLIRGVAVC